MKAQTPEEIKSISRRIIENHAEIFAKSLLDSIAKRIASGANQGSIVKSFYKDSGPAVALAVKALTDAGWRVKAVPQGIEVSW